MKTVTSNTQESTLIQIESTRAHKDTVDGLVAAIEAKGFRVFIVIDHQANAEGVGLALLPTTVIVFGNPKVGTKLMQASRTHAIDLPQKFLVWQDLDERVFITHNSPLALASRHSLPEGSMAVVGNIEMALKSFANAAVGAP